MYVISCLSVEAFRTPQEQDSSSSSSGANVTTSSNSSRNLIYSEFSNSLNRIMNDHIDYEKEDRIFALEERKLELEKQKLALEELKLEIDRQRFARAESHRQNLVNSMRENNIMMMKLVQSLFEYVISSKVEKK